jgi:hypothetical protein
MARSGPAGTLTVITGACGATTFAAAAGFTPGAEMDATPGAEMDVATLGIAAAARAAAFGAATDAPPRIGGAGGK